VYDRGGEWVAKLDTIVHELYHVDPHQGGIRQSVKGDGSPAAQTHTPQFFLEVQRMVREYVGSRPDPLVYEFLTLDFAGLVKRHGGVTATTFRDFPAFPQRYRERLADQPRGPRAAQVVPLPQRTPRRHFTDADLVIREFLPGSTRRLQSRGQTQPPRSTSSNSADTFNLPGRGPGTEGVTRPGSGTCHRAQRGPATRRAATNRDVQ